MKKQSQAQIAIVDDDALVRAALRDCLESAGYIVESFESAEDFLASSSEQNPACLIFDLQLPGMSGLELQSRLVRANKCAPIIFVSGHGTDTTREQAMKLGAAGFLAKPFRRRELLTIVQAALRA